MLGRGRTRPRTGLGDPGPRSQAPQSGRRAAALTRQDPMQRQGDVGQVCVEKEVPVRSAELQPGPDQGPPRAGQRPGPQVGGVVQVGWRDDAGSGPRPRGPWEDPAHSSRLPLGPGPPCAGGSVAPPCPAPVLQCPAHCYCPASCFPVNKGEAEMTGQRHPALRVTRGGRRQRGGHQHFPVHLERS